MRKTNKIWWVFWSVCVAVCLAHYWFMDRMMPDVPFIHIEHKYYLVLLAIACVSFSKIPYGKPVLWIILFLGLRCLYQLPEHQEMIALDACGEGDCQPAVQMGIVKISGDRWEYIPLKDRI